MTDDLRVAEVRMRLFDAAHAVELTHLENLTGLPRGTLAHALMAIPKVDKDVAGASLAVFDLWLEWEPMVRADASGYENFAVFVRNKVKQAQR